MSRRQVPAFLAIVALFVWFNAGSNTYRFADRNEIAKHPSSVLWPPWKLAQLYVSRNGDEHLYFEYSRLVLGEQADLPYIAAKRQGNTAANLRQLELQVDPRARVRLPYRDFPFEYPPLALLLMLAPRLVVHGLDGYRVVFGALTGLLYLLSAALATRLATAIASPAPVWSRMAWLLLAVGPIVCARFDLLPAVLVTTALWALSRNRTSVAAVSLGLAGLAKLYPFLLLLPIAAFLWGAAERRRAVLVSVGAVFTAGLLSLPFLALAPAAYLKSVALYEARPLQIESLLGCVVLGIRGKAAVIGSFGSFNVVTPNWLGRSADLLFWGALVALGAGAFLLGRRARSSSSAERLRGLVLWTFASIVVLLCVSRVLSPQFMLWLVPLPAIFIEPRARSIFLWTVVAAALTQVFYPNFYQLVRNGRALGVSLVLARNAVLVLLATFAIRSAWRQQPS